MRPHICFCRPFIHNVATQGTLHTITVSKGTYQHQKHNTDNKPKDKFLQPLWMVLSYHNTTQMCRVIFMVTKTITSTMSVLPSSCRVRTSNHILAVVRLVCGLLRFLCLLATQCCLSTEVKVLSIRCPKRFGKCTTKMQSSSESNPSSLT